MLSRKTTRAIAEAYEKRFRRLVYDYPSYYRVSVDALYDFLFERDYEPWFCNQARATYQMRGTRKLKDFILKLHTGESPFELTKDWSLDQRKKLGQQYLFNLAQDVLHELIAQYNYSGRIDRERKEEIRTLLALLELDGYIYDDKSSRLLAPEEDVLDVEHESGILESLTTSLQLDNKTTILHHLKLSEEHYLDQKWDDSISNSRKYLESILQEVATAHNDRIKGSPLPKKVYGSPFKVRDYLQNEGLLEAKEKETLAKIYGLLSETGGHPYMARNDQARLLRHLALTFSQFVMLRLQGSLAKVV